MMMVVGVCIILVLCVEVVGGVFLLLGVGNVYVYRCFFVSWYFKKVV